MTKVIDSFSNDRHRCFVLTKIIMQMVESFTLYLFDELFTFVITYHHYSFKCYECNISQLIVTRLIGLNSSNIGSLKRRNFKASSSMFSVYNEQKCYTYPCSPLRVFARPFLSPVISCDTPCSVMPVDENIDFLVYSYEN